MMRYMRLRPTTRKLERKSRGAAGFDLYVDLGAEGNSMRIQPHETRRIPTGIAVELGSMFCGLILPRSSSTDVFDTKHPPIDPDYRGEIHIILHNTSVSEYDVKHGERIAQLIVVPCYPNDLVESQELSATERGSGGFGSTGHD